MKTVSMAELKRALARWVQEAAAGETVVITRHDRPVARLVSAAPTGLRVGERAGPTTLRPLLHRATNGAWRRILEEDRADDR